MTGRCLLLLGGTSEARELAAGLTTVPGLRVVTSLAGRVSTPGSVDGERRVGGFGGVEGLAGWVRDHDPVVLIDATHPFAARISCHAVTAATRTGTPLLRLLRPGWTAGPGDRWYRVPDLAAAAALLPLVGARALVTTGHRELGAFAVTAAGAGLTLVVRCVEPPVIPLPPRTRVLVGRGPYTVGGETALLRAHRVDVLVTKDSGGAATRAKLDAARMLGIPVIMVDRPPSPLLDTASAHLVTPAPMPVPMPVPMKTVSTVSRALRWVRLRLAAGTRPELGN